MDHVLTADIIHKANDLAKNAWLGIMYKEMNLSFLD